MILCLCLLVVTSVLKLFMFCLFRFVWFYVLLLMCGTCNVSVSVFCFCSDCRFVVDNSFSLCGFGLFGCNVWRCLLDSKQTRCVLLDILKR